MNTFEARVLHAFVLLAFAARSVVAPVPIEIGKLKIQISEKILLALLH